MEIKEIISSLSDIALWVVLFIPIALVIYKQYKSNKSAIQSMKDFNDVRGEFENVMADVVAGVIPWLSGFIPAYLSYRHAIDVLGIPAPIALILGIVVEGLAFANVSTFTEISQFKREKEGIKKYSKGQVPLWTLLATLGIYLFVVLTLNGMLTFIILVPMDVFYSALMSGDAETLFVLIAPALIKTFAILLISLLTIPGAMTISLRMQHKQYVRDKTAPRKKAVSDDIPVPKPELIMTTELEKILNLATSMFDNTGSLNKSVLSKQIGISRPTLDKKLKELNRLSKLTILDDKSITIP